MKEDYDFKGYLEDCGDSFANFLTVKDYKGARMVEDELASKGLFEEALSLTRLRCKMQMMDNCLV